MASSISKILDRRGQPIINTPPRKNAAGLYGNIYSYQNQGKFQNRFYTLGDSNQGIDTLSRELLVRWSREMFAQLPFIPSATKVLADFTVGDGYLPMYKGSNKKWWDKAEEYLLNIIYPNCCVRGSAFDFQTCLRLESQLLDVDGDYLAVYGMEDDIPKFQLIQNNRIGSGMGDSFVVESGKYRGCIVSDGIYYTMKGKPVAYCVRNAGNLVNNMAKQTDDMVFDANSAHLIFDPKTIDKNRGIPSIGSAILQALSIQELDSYLIEKIKIQSTVAYVEKNHDGQAPQELQNTLEALRQQSAESGYMPNVNEHSVEIRQGVGIRYVNADGGDIKMLDGNSPGSDTANYMARLETQVLSCLGVPHQLIYSTNATSGRITSGIAEIFRSSIERRQKILDKRATFYLSWALSKAMEAGFIPYNDAENISKVVSVSHPQKFSFDKKYDSQITISEYEAGMSCLNDATSTLYNKSAEETMEEQKNEQIMFYKKAQEVSNATGVDLNTVISGWRMNQKLPAPAPLDNITSEETNEE